MRTVYYIRGSELMKLIFSVLCHERRALHVVIKRKVFLHLYKFRFTLPYLRKRVRKLFLLRFSCGSQRKCPGEGVGVNVACDDLVCLCEAKNN